MSNKITINVKRKPQRKGDIYLIRCKGDPIYVGKTITMTKRRNMHKNDTRGPIWKHAAKFGLTEFDYDYEILETMQVVDEYDKKLCAAEATHFHCFTEQGYQLLNERVPNNGCDHDRNSIAYANSLARDKQKIPCEFCGLVGAWGNRHGHQKSDKCRYFRMYQFTQNLTL